jgi:hypothetical protein
VEKFTKKDMLSKIALHETNSIQMELNKKITEPSKGLFLISGKASTLKWLEILRNEEGGEVEVGRLVGWGARVGI